jgi:hypothetical protein
MNENRFDEYSIEYDMPESTTQYVDSGSNEVVDGSELTDWQKIQLVAQKIGVKIKEPKENCKKCNGTGKIGYRVGTKEPMICSCIFESKEFENLRPMQFNHAQRRQMIKNFKRENKKMNKKSLNSANIQQSVTE